MQSEIDRLEAVMIALANFITPLYRYWGFSRTSFPIHTHNRREWQYIAMSTVSLMHLVRETVDYWHKILNNNIKAGTLWPDPPIKRILWNHHTQEAIHLNVATDEKRTLLDYSGRFVQPEARWFIPYGHINHTNEHEFFERICAHIAILIHERQWRIDREIEMDEDIHVWVDRWLRHLRSLLIMIHENLDLRSERRPPIWLEIDLPSDRALPDGPYTLSIGQLTLLLAHPEEIDFWETQSAARKPMLMPEPRNLVNDNTARRVWLARQALHCEYVYRHLQLERTTMAQLNERFLREGGPSALARAQGIDLLSDRMQWFRAQIEQYEQGMKVGILTEARTTAKGTAASWYPPAQQSLTFPSVSRVRVQRAHSTYDVKQYLREAATEAQLDIEERGPLEFTDQPPERHEWTEEMVERMNRTIRALLNSPVSYEALDEILKWYLLDERWRHSLNYVPKGILFPRVLDECFAWQYWDEPAEGAWKEGLSLETFLSEWRQCQVKEWDIRTPKEEEDAGMQAFAEIWLHNDHLYSGTPVQEFEDTDAPTMMYEIDRGRVTDEDRKKAMQRRGIYLAMKAKGHAPAAMSDPIPLNKYKRPKDLPPKSLDTVFYGKDCCLRCLDRGLVDCRVPKRDYEDPRCVACIDARKGCSFKKHGLPVVSKGSTNGDAEASDVGAAGKRGAPENEEVMGEEGTAAKRVKRRKLVE
ncbi:uncharacterized protein B0H18DRAFT_963235 [Fomitopsis serialis]|uniref:uncharacterized protein n=1 Tax=Fomitopsis serialis TaxID=139415 RepID=UPI002007C595|nr:uncharacterized protein B0H18DRAFT_963235 [Neoantrodia serialis]KAH9910506.1 hypothetical protein B0H18DRAFT_963235 [Neoantrodia serialis]